MKPTAQLCALPCNARPAPGSAAAFDSLALAALAALAGLAGLPALPAQQALPRGEAEAPGIDHGALAALLERAAATHSDALVVLHGGRILVEEYFGKERAPIEAMSVTKSIVSMAIGHLLDAGRIEGIDVPVHTIYPQWKQGRKKDVTLRHLLAHTSGLQADRTTEEIYASPDFVELALAAELSDAPGERFFYNNKAVNLLAGIVAKVSGQRLDEYLGEHVFAPLGITEWTWTLDRAGNPHAMAGLQTHALDLARLGQVMAQGGTWNGRRILSREWVAASWSPGEGEGNAAQCGLLWRLIPSWTKFAIDDALIEEWRAAGVPEDFIERVAPMRNRQMDRRAFGTELQAIFGADDMESWHRMTWKSGRRDAAVTRGPPMGFSANGYLGQYLVVLPEAELVAVRQIRPGSHQGFQDGFGDFQERVLALVAK